MDDTREIVPLTKTPETQVDIGDAQDRCKNTWSQLNLSMRGDPKEEPGGTSIWVQEKKQDEILEEEEEGGEVFPKYKT